MEMQLTLALQGQTFALLWKRPERKRMCALSRVVMVVVQNKWRHAVDTPYPVRETKGKLSSTFVHDKVPAPKFLSGRKLSRSSKQPKERNGGKINGSGEVGVD